MINFLFKKIFFIVFGVLILLSPFSNKTEAQVDKYFFFIPGDMNDESKFRSKGHIPTETKGREIGPFESLEDCQKEREGIFYTEKLTDKEKEKTLCTKETNVSGTLGSESGEKYQLLSGIPGLQEVDETTSFSKYINILFRLLIGLTTIIAVISVIIGGFQYMTTDAWSGKSDGILKIKKSLLGLVLAISSWVILNMINPNILNIEFLKSEDQVRVIISQDSFLVEGEYTEDSTGYTSNQPSAGAVEINNKIKNSGGLINIVDITVDTTTKKASFRFTDGQTTEIDVGIGKKGSSEIGEAKKDDGKTPKGTYTLGTVRNEISIDGKPVLSNTTPKVNLGAAFISINAFYQGTYRGIGIHGFKSGKIGQTNGCISMTNGDLILIAPYLNNKTLIIK